MDDDKPECFGVLERVFPMGEDGLRETPVTCMACTLKTMCLKSAFGESSGFQLEEEMVDRAYHSGRMGFLERWSKKKQLSKKRKK